MAELLQEAVTGSANGQAAEPADNPPSAAVSPGRMAWGVLLAAFAVFCLLGFSSLFLVYYYLFQSSVAIPTALHVAQGTVGITGSDLIETVEREWEDLTNTLTGISTDSQSQATLQFWNDRPAESDPDLIAAVTLQRNTFIKLSHTSQPRFEWSLNQQDIQLSKLDGQVEVLVSGVGGQPFHMSIATEQGVKVYFTQNGRYRLTASHDEVRLLNLAGEAVVLFADEAANPSLVSGGQELTARLGSRTIETRMNVENALVNADFSLQGVAAADGSPNLPERWGCSQEQDAPPRGSFSVEQFDGRAAIRLNRLENTASSNGKVSCLQLFGRDGLDVSGVDSLRVLATFNLNYQSLSRCGIDGSECPLMLLIDYEDRRGQSQKWYKGFYYDDLLVDAYPTRCDSCPQDHQNINRRVWYTYESANLFYVIDELLRPARLRSISFYASGHQFDTLVSEVLLLVSAAEAQAEA